MAIAAFLIIATLGVRSDLLREGNQTGKPYSFHKFQLWVWTMIICPSFALYWGFDAAHVPSINETALVLLGISGATTITAEMINANQESNPNRNASLKAMTLLTTGFWSDILKDDSGQLSIGRLQQLLFTFIYAGMYISSFFPNMVYPVFNPNAYMLMGISTGAYLLGKGLYK
jgi:hypothetical protein